MLPQAAARSTAASPSRSSTSTRRWPGTPASSSWTSWRTPTRRARGTPSAGRTSRSCSRRASTSTPRSTSSTSRASTTSWPRSPGSRCARRCRTPCSTRPTRSSWRTCRPTTCWSGCGEGKVYVPEQAAAAIERFFRKGNLIALRELALRRTAERVDAQMRGYMREAGIQSTVAGGRPAAGVHRPESRRRAAGARRQAHGHRAQVRVAGGPRGPRGRARLARRARGPPRQPPAGRVAGRRDGGAERPERGGSHPRVRARAQRHQDRHRQAHPPALARQAVRFHARPAGAGQRRRGRLRHQRRHRGAAPAAGGRRPRVPRRRSTCGPASPSRSPPRWRPWCSGSSRWPTWRWCICSGSCSWRLATAAGRPSRRPCSASACSTSSSSRRTTPSPSPTCGTC